jgi:hypothetical protein
MEFDIRPLEGMQKYPNAILLSPFLRQRLGVIEGQFLQIKAGQEELVLQICNPPHPSPELELEIAFVSPQNYIRINAPEVEYKILEVTLGCDPEFFILWGNRRISAATYLPPAGEIGCDGELGELRPMYGRHEDQVVANLARLIPRIPAKMKRSHWATGFPNDGNRFSYEAHSYHLNIAAGFHIHLGIPPEILNTRKDFNRAAMNHLVQCLDWYVSVPLVPIETSHGRRIGRSGYGRPGDYRPSNITLEYRTPGAFYLRTPSLARGLLGLSLLVVENIVSRMKRASQNFVKLHKLSPADLHEIMPKPEAAQIQRILTYESIQPALSQLERIQTQLEALPSYPKHQRAVKELFRAVEDRTQPSPNLLRNWEERT